MNIKVSIIVPIYNVEDYLHECLESLVNQTLKDIEIILIDDGSTDSSGEICEEYEKNDKRIKVLHKQNAGQSAARNDGLNISRGEYVIYVDSDDFIVINACERLYNTAKKYNAEIVHGDLLNDKEKMLDASFRKIDGENEAIDGLDFLKQTIITKSYDIVPFIKMIKRSHILENNIRFKEGYFYEDQEFSLKLYTVAPCKVVKIRFPFYYYRMSRPGSTTTSTNIKKVADLVYILKAMIDYVEACNKSTQIKQYMFTTVFIGFNHLAYFWLLLNKDDRKLILKQISPDFKEKALKYYCNYSELVKNCKQFAYHPYLFAFKYDFRKLLGRVVFGGK